MTGKPGGKKRGAAALRGRRVALGGALALLTLLMASAGVAMDRAEFAKVLHVIPPNGPFWKYGNVVLRMRSRPAGMEPVIFSHLSHRSRYTCRVCHQELGFSMRQGDTGITRKDIVAGKYCGACHNGTVAFHALEGAERNCKKCHREQTDDLEKQFAKFSAHLPMAPFGNGIDWAEALRSGEIAPANTLDGSAPPLPFPEKLKQPLKLGTASDRSDVGFSHEDHFAELDCSSCHPDIFNIKRKSTASFSMETNIYGSFCGACHMLVAFPMNDCKRCHHGMNTSTNW
jgi:c(7)-type cytochrome triheme protein